MATLTSYNQYVKLSIAGTGGLPAAGNSAIILSANIDNYAQNQFGNVISIPATSSSPASSTVNNVSKYTFTKVSLPSVSSSTTIVVLSANADDYAFNRLGAIIPISPTSGGTVSSVLSVGGNKTPVTTVQLTQYWTG